MGDTTTTTGGADWASWFQGVASKVIGAAADAKYSQPYEIQRLQIQALGADGIYTEGQPGFRATGGGQGINGGALLLIGAAVLLVVLMKD